MNWSKVGSIGLNVLGAVVPQVGAIERLAQVVPSLKGAQKEDAVIMLTQQALAAAEQASGKDLLNNQDVEDATRDLIRAYVALQNVLARHVPDGQSPAPPVSPAASQPLQ